MNSKNQHLSISVIIPTYNRAAFIAAAIQSALDQTRKPHDIIVVDDGSQDDTPKILAEFGPPVIAVRQPNGGEAAARNTGLSIASGDAVIFLDSDDLLMPDCLERCARVLEENPDVGVVYTDAQLVDPDGHFLDLYSRSVPGNRPSGMVLGELARRNFLLVTSMVRRSLIGETKFDQGLVCCADYDFWRQLSVRCRFQFLNEPLMCYRFHPSMTVATRLAETLASEAETQRRIMAMPEFKTLTEKEQARAYCIHGIKQGMLGATGVARSFFGRAIRTSPGYASAYLLWLLSLFGKRVLQYAILKRRQLAGNRLGTAMGPSALMKKKVSGKRGLGRTRAVGNLGVQLPAGEAT